MATPEGWERRPIRSVATSYSGGTPSRSVAAYFGGGIPWVKSGEVNARRIRQTEETISQEGLDNSSAKWVEPGSVLVAMYGATAGKVARLDIRATVNQAILAVHGRADSANNEFLFHVLDAATPELVRRTQGSGQPNLSGKLIQDLAVLLPPLPEQRKIAAILSAVDEVIEKTEAVIESLQALKKAMMQELLTRGLPGRHTRFKQTEIGEVPEGWEVVSLKCVVDFQPGYAFKSADFAVSGDRLLRGSNVAPGAIDWESDKTKFFPTERRNEVQEYVLRANDIVIGMDRPFVNSGFKIARMTDTDLPALLLQRVGRFVRLAGHLDSEYLWVVARSGFVEGHLRVQQKGTDLPHISRDEILDSVIPLPPPQEQRAIGEVFASIDRRTLSERSALARSMVVKSALMSVLLTGELRVTPDQDVA